MGNLCRWFSISENALFHEIGKIFINIILVQLDNFRIVNIFRWLFGSPISLFTHSGGKGGGDFRYWHNTRIQMFRTLLLHMWGSGIKAEYKGFSITSFGGVRKGDVNCNVINCFIEYFSLFLLKYSWLLEKKYYLIACKIKVV